MCPLVACGWADWVGLGWAAQPPAAGWAWLLTEGQVCSKCVCSGPRLKRQRLPGEALLIPEASPPSQARFKPVSASCVLTPHWPNKSRGWTQGQGVKKYGPPVRQSLVCSHRARVIGRGESWAKNSVYHGCQLSHKHNTLFFFLLYSYFIYLFIYFWLCWVFGSCEDFL